ncbi:MAG: hypothetical protein Q8P46_11295 [Hyphomicrobiales bacterium]|jgi:hypothetical protein|nr:hypothetical protein [Hyphomicrobiales bacterium]
MTTDRLLAFLSLAGFFAFLAVTVAFVKEFDLFVVLTLAFAMAAFDFWRTMARTNAKNNGGSS